MTVASHPQTEEYLRRLDRAARVLPRHERDELLAEIRSHIAEGLAPGAGEADVRNLLDDLGEPADIVAAARPHHLPVRRGAREVFALILLVTGLPPVFGWLAGLGLLLWSPLWSTRQKLLGMLVWPGGYATAFVVSFALAAPARKCSASSTSPGPILPYCEGGDPIVVAGLRVAASIVLVVAPLLVAAYLYRAAGKRAQSA